MLLSTKNLQTLAAVSLFCYITIFVTYLYTTSTLDVLNFFADTIFVYIHTGGYKAFLSQLLGSIYKIFCLVCLSAYLIIL